METSVHSTRSWDSTDLKIVDEIYSAWQKSKDVQFVKDHASAFIVDKMLAVFQNEKVSDVMLQAMRPKTLGATACDFEQMLNEIRTTKLREIWFEGPFFVIANFGDEEMSGREVARFIRQNSFMQRIMAEVTG
jgi:SpoVK/Ycf46/Vps4 family AAA+-type ATPase